MALKPDRVELLTNVSFFMTAVADRGGIACVKTSGAGASMDDAGAVVEYAAAVTGKPVGILLNDVVDLDLTRQHINWYKDEVQVGGKVTLLRQGEVVTNKLVSGITPAAGDAAYVGASGFIGTSSASSAAKIGQFLSSKDADGYAKVSVNIV
jgi:hypothetical protein